MVRPGFFINHITFNIFSLIELFRGFHTLYAKVYLPNTTCSISAIHFFQDVCWARYTIRFASSILYFSWFYCGMWYVSFLTFIFLFSCTFYFLCLHSQTISSPVSYFAVYCFFSCFFHYFFLDFHILIPRRRW